MCGHWGEGHEIYSPANVRDLWSRIFAWFDELGDIARDVDGTMIFDGDRAQSRRGAAPWTPQRFLELQNRQ